MSLIRKKSSASIGTHKRDTRQGHHSNLSELHVRVLSFSGISKDSFKAKHTKVTVKVHLDDNYVKTGPGVKLGTRVVWGGMGGGGVVDGNESRDSKQQRASSANMDSFPEGEALCIPVEGHGLDSMELTVEWKGALLRLTKGDLMKALLNLTESELVAMEDTTPLVPVLRVEGYVPGNDELSKTCFLDIRMALVRRDHPLHGHSMHDFWASARCDTEVRSVVSSPVHQPLSWSVSNGLNQKQEPDDPTCLTFGHTDDQIASDDESMTETHESIHSSQAEEGRVQKKGTPTIKTELYNSKDGEGDGGDDTDSKASIRKGLLNKVQAEAKKATGAYREKADRMLDAVQRYADGSAAEAHKIAGTRLFIRVYRGAGLRFPSALVLDHQKNAHRVFVTCRLAKQRVDTPVAVESLPNPEWDYRDFSVRDMIFDVFKQCENFEFKVRMKHNTGFGPKYFIAGGSVPLSRVKVLGVNETPDDIPMEWVTCTGRRKKLKDAKHKKTDNDEYDDDDDAGDGYSDMMSLYSGTASTAQPEENAGYGSIAFKMCLVTPEHAMYGMERMFWQSSVCRGPKAAATWRLYLRVLAGFNMSDPFPGPEILKARRAKILRPAIYGKYQDQLEQSSLGSRIPVSFWEAGTADLVFEVSQFELDGAIDLSAMLQVPEHLALSSLRTHKVGAATIRMSDVPVLKPHQSAKEVPETFVYLYRKGVQAGHLRLQTVFVPPTHQLNRSISFWSTTTENLRNPLGTLRVAIKRAKIKALTNRPQVGVPDKHYCIIQHAGVFKKTPAVPSLTPKWELANFDFTVFELSTSTIVYVFVEGTDKFIGSYIFKLSSLWVHRVYQTWVPLVRKSSKKMYKLGGEILLECELQCDTVHVLPIYLKPIAAAVLNPCRSALEKEVTRLGINRRTIKYFTRDPEKIFQTKLTKSHVWRIINMAQPFKLIGQMSDYVMEWTDVPFSIFINLLWCFYCFHSHLILPHLMLFIAASCMWYRSSMEHLPTRQLPQILQDIQDEDSDEEGADEEELDDALNTFSEGGELEKSSKKEADDDGTGKKKKSGSGNSANPIAQLQHTINVITRAMLTVQNKLGLVASLMEAVVTPLTWDDPRITLLIASACGLLGMVQLLILPSRYVFMVLGLIVFRHPILRSDGSVPANFLSRLPNRKKEMDLLL